MSDSSLDTKPFQPQTKSAMPSNDDRELVLQALEGSLTEDQKRIAEVGIGLIAKLIRKNTDYGSSVFKKPRFAPKCDPGDAILVRMGDKVARMENIAENEAFVKEELFEETFDDFIAYGILWLARPRS
jgi:hypothetical protein